MSISMVNLGQGQEATGPSIEQSLLDLAKAINDFCDEHESKQKMQ